MSMAEMLENKKFAELYQSAAYKLQEGDPSDLKVLLDTVLYQQGVNTNLAERKTKLEQASQGMPIRGNEAASVTIVEFSDFQCPYCARAATIVDEVLEEFAGALDSDERAVELLNKQAWRYRGLERDKAKRRMLGFLARRGYEADMARKAVDQVWQELADEVKGS